MFFKSFISNSIWSPNRNSSVIYSDNYYFDINLQIVPSSLLGACDTMSTGYFTKLPDISESPKLTSSSYSGSYFRLIGTSDIFLLRAFWVIWRIESSSFTRIPAISLSRCLASNSSWSLIFSLIAFEVSIIVLTLYLCSLS